jgi:hypothetical protein
MKYVSHPHCGTVIKHVIDRYEHWKSSRGCRLRPTASLPSVRRLSTKWRSFEDSQPFNPPQPVQGQRYYVDLYLYIRASIGHLTGTDLLFSSVLYTIMQYEVLVAVTKNTVILWNVPKRDLQILKGNHLLAVFNLRYAYLWDAQEHFTGYIKLKKY